MEKTLKIDISAFRTQSDQSALNERRVTPLSACNPYDRKPGENSHFDYWARIEGADNEYGFNSPEELARIIVHTPEVMNMINDK
ncbi:hypothetical protein [Oceanospirillum sediminis]|uniref:Uncharacterized protein n=1 Tax=Oceanospirillum sediminis TaxID=2760088 RepID=A0A839IUG3_9GAMM|nr:hypothetical protein [Oceanospirillum sediminis]MBB1488581.1 hypothetical protein [Oceanospirillum sediminis]